MRVLFFNEGNLGSLIMGQGQLELALRIGLGEDAQVRFSYLPPIGPVSHSAAVRTFGLLRHTGLEFRALRWHTIQALRARRALAGELRLWPADIVHVHSHTIAFAMAPRATVPPLVLSVDTTARDWWAMPSWRSIPGDREVALGPSAALERRTLRRAALVLAWTAWARDAVQRTAPGARVVEHHPGIDLERYRPEPRRERALPRVLFVGGRFAEKGGENLLEAVGDRLGRELELDLVTPAEVAERPGLRVHRLGAGSPELLELYRQADIFCLPTLGDAAPWAVLEAMASGTPVISTRIGGIPDMLGHGEAGVLVEHSDPRALRESIGALLADEGRRSTLGAAARARCEQRYDARRQVPQLLGLLRGLAA